MVIVSSANKAMRVQGRGLHVVGDLEEENCSALLSDYVGTAPSAEIEGGCFGLEAGMVACGYCRSFIMMR